VFPSWNDLQLGPGVTGLFCNPSTVWGFIEEFRFLSPCCRYSLRAWRCVQGWSRPCGTKRLADTHFILWTVL